MELHYLISEVIENTKFLKQFSVKYTSYLI